MLLGGALFCLNLAVCVSLSTLLKTKASPLSLYRLLSLKNTDYKHLALSLSS